jgi:predicted PurR-regulated permease PerM
MKSSRSPGMQDNAVYITRLLIAVGIFVFVFIVWQLREIFLLLFGASVIAMMLHALTGPISRHTILSRRWALFASILIIVLVSGCAVWLAGSEMSSEFLNLSTQIPEAWRSLKEKAESYALGQYVFDRVDGLRHDSGGVVSKLSIVAVSIVNSITDLILILVGGFYLAIDPELYHEGALKLIPRPARRRVEEALDSAGISLNKWLIAKMMEMVIVGILTTVGLLIIDFPSALALGLVAGIAEFVPYFGLIVAIIPAALIALTLGPEMLASVILVYTIVQQVEGNIIMPFIELKIAYVPPVLTIFSLVVFGLLFGPLGLLFAAPLTVVLMVLIKKLYMEGALDEK